MMKFRFIAICVLLISLLNEGAAFVFGEESKSKAVSMPIDREEIIRVFKEAVRLNEEFKGTAASADNLRAFQDYQDKRKVVEEYHEEKHIPRLRECVRLLSSQKDLVVAEELFKMLLSHENSADEELSYSLGSVFLRNPDVIIETFAKFPKLEQRQLYARLEWGWENVIYGKNKTTPRVVDRAKRLKQLKAKVSSD